MPWRVQATWTVGEEARQYVPIWLETEAEARRKEAEIADTLWHFPTLKILVQEVDRAAFEAGISEDGVRGTQ